MKKSVVLMLGLMTLSSISNNVLAETFVRSDEMGGKQGLYPESGEVFKSNVFTFEEGKTYKFSDFVKEKDSLGSLIVSGCGMNSTYVSDSRDRLGQSMYSGGDLARPLHEYADILLFDYSKSAIESGYVTFVKGSKNIVMGQMYFLLN